ncbi:MAG TPA: hydantoinase/oxoprolinase N-terminal domain-containing protein, partial [Nitrososphaerales archaeon]|nr:hydantoinase/oxoprolinase N-terminal domain-containing protein [Nitrososphaerales archaeon]
MLPSRQGSLTIAVDVGGTFTDVIVGTPQGLLVAKLPTSSQPSDSVMSGLSKMKIERRDVSLVTHATTLATNVLLTRTGLPRAALVTNEGFRDILEIGRQRRPDLYELNVRRAPPLIPREDRLTLRCRIGADGSEVERFDPVQMASLARKIVRSGYESVAIAFLHSYLDSRHERTMRAALEEEGFPGPITLSSEINPEYREYERTSTAVVNAVLSPFME